MSDETIDVPNTVLIRCPKTEFKLTPVADCSQCGSFAGLAARFPGDAIPFAKNYLVLCRSEPVKRELFEVAA